MRTLLLPRWWWLVVAVLIAAPVFAQLNTPGTIRLVRIVGNVSVEDTQTGQRQSADAAVSLTQGYVVRTELQSSVVLVFSNGSSVNLGPNSELNIQEFLQDPFAEDVRPALLADEPTTSQTRLELTRGELVGNVKKLRRESGSNFTVQTPAGAAGIRGTLFRIVLTQGDDNRITFTLTTVEGEVGYVSPGGSIESPQAFVAANQEVLVEIDRNEETGAVTVITPLAEIVPQPADAATLAEIVAAFEQMIEVMIDLVFPPGGTGEGGSGSDAAQFGDTPPELGRGNPDLTPGDGAL